MSGAARGSASVLLSETPLRRPDTTLDSGLWPLASGLWSLDSRLWTLDSGLWTLDSGLWSQPLKNSNTQNNQTITHSGRQSSPTQKIQQRVSLSPVSDRLLSDAARVSASVLLRETPLRRPDTTLDSGLWPLASGLWSLDSGLWTLDSGLWTLEPTTQELKHSKQSHNHTLGEAAADPKGPTAHLALPSLGQALVGRSARLRLSLAEQSAAAPTRHAPQQSHLS